jgi:hypothetical protein
VAPPFDAEQGFGFDKPAHTACMHLGKDFRCSIHDRLAEQGFPACASFDCFGAGQRVTAQFAEQGEWSTKPAVAAQIFDSYQRMRALHEMLAMTMLAKSRAATEMQQDALDSLLQELESAARSVATVDVSTLRQSVLLRIRNTLLLSS